MLAVSNYNFFRSSDFFRFNEGAAKALLDENLAEKFSGSDPCNAAVCLNDSLMMTFIKLFKKKVCILQFDLPQ